MRKALDNGLQCDMFKTMKKNQQPGAQYVSDSGWRELVRCGIRTILFACSPTLADFLYRQIRGVCKRIGATSEKQVVQLRSGGHMSLDLSDYSQRAMYYCGFYELNFSACLARYVSEGKVFVDVGANVGYYTIWGALRVGKTGHLYSFEPNPKAFAALQENVALNHLGNVEIQNVALGASEAMAYLNPSYNDLGLSHLTRSKTGDDLLLVPVQTLDKCLEDVKRYPILKIDVLKIDAEGAEMSILQGAHEYLTGDSPPYLLVEVDDKMLRRLGNSEQALLQYLNDLGYMAHEITRSGNLKPYNPTNRPGHNLFFVPPGKPVL